MKLLHLIHNTFCSLPNREDVGSVLGVGRVLRFSHSSFIFYLSSFIFYLSSFIFYLLPLPLHAQFVTVRGGGFYGGYYDDGEDYTDYLVTGHVYGSDEMDDKPYALPNASVRLYCQNDTTGKGGGQSDKDGKFSAWGSVKSKSIKKKDAVRVKVEVTYMGYKPYEATHTLKREPVMWGNRVHGYRWEIKLDSIVLKAEPMTMKEVEIVSELSKMFETEDTTVFNVDAFQMPKGSVLLNLIRRMPGLDYEDGVLTYKDSVINEIRLNGESFFKNDMKVALNNIENADLKQFKIYHAAIDTTDANSQKQLVADMITKKPVTRTIVYNLEAGTASKKKTYQLDTNGMEWYNNDRGEWNMNAFLHDLPSASSEKSGQNYMSGHVRKKFGPVQLSFDPNYNYNDNRSSNESLSATYMPGYQQYSQNTSSNRSYSSSTDQRLRADGKIGEKGGNWNTDFGFGYSDSRSHSNSNSATYKDNPFRGDTHELMSEDSLRAIGLNRTTNESHSRSHSMNWNWRGRYTLNFGEDNKNNLGVNFNIRNSRSHTTGEEIRSTEYLQYGDSVWNYRRQQTSPSTNHNYSVDAFYNYKLTKMHSIRVSQLFAYNDSESDREYFDMENDMQRLDSLSSHNYNSTRREQTGVRIYFNWEHISFDAGTEVSVSNQTYDYARLDGIGADTAVTNILYSPSANFSWRYKDNASVTLTYRFNNNAPGLSQLVMPTTNDDPLYIQRANPHLRHSLSHNINLDWRLNSHLSFSTSYSPTQRSISSRSIYNTTTGGVVTSPENIDGNWSIRNAAFYNLAKKHYSFDIQADHNYRHNVSYVRTQDGGNTVKGISKNHNYSVSPSFRLFSKKYELRTRGNYRYQTSSYDYMDNGDSHHSYNLSLDAEWRPNDNLMLSTTASLSGQFGYQMSSANRNDFIWNFKGEYRVLKDKRGTIRLEWFDILRQRRTYSASASSTGWSESRTSGTPSYGILSFEYRFYKMK